MSPPRCGIANTRLVVEELKNGGLTMYPAIVRAIAETRRCANPDAVARLKQALASANKGGTRHNRLTSERD